MRPTIHDQTWSNETPCQSIFWKRNQVAVNGQQISTGWRRVSEASVARESSACGAACWRGTAAVRRRFTFWKASCARATHSNVLGTPFRRSIKGCNACAHLGRKRRKKFTMPRKRCSCLMSWGGRWFNFAGVTGPRGRSCCQNRVTKNLQRGHCKNTFFQIFAPIWGSS